MNVVMALFPLIMLIAMGYIFKRTQFLTDEFWRGAEKTELFDFISGITF